jgi:hypothetical protein
MAHPGAWSLHMSPTPKAQPGAFSLNLKAMKPHPEAAESHPEALEICYGDTDLALDP